MRIEKRDNIVLNLAIECCFSTMLLSRFSILTSLLSNKYKMEHLKYPIGRFKKPANIDAATINNWITEIEEIPTLLKDLTEKLSEEDLNRTYRPDGWTIRQVVHHVMDSHINAYIRFKWTLTEDNPTIKAYKEALWAELPDTQKTPITISLYLLSGLHYRWSILMRSLSEEDLNRTFLPPESGKTFSLKEMVGAYAWHGKHHLEHVKIALKG